MKTKIIITTLIILILIGVGFAQVFSKLKKQELQIMQLQQFNSLTW